MKNLINAILMSISIGSFVIAQEAKPKKTSAEQAPKTSNDIALEALNHVKSIFAITAKASDTANANLAATEITETTKKIIALDPILKATPMPTAAEKKDFAKKMLQYQIEVATIIKKMTQTLDNNSEEVNALIQPAITNFQAKIKPIMDRINIYYPKDEMNGYIQELKGK